MLSTSTKEERIKSNQDVYSFSLTSDEKDAIANLNEEASSFFQMDAPETSERFLKFEGKDIK